MSGHDKNRKRYITTESEGQAEKSKNESGVYYKSFCGRRCYTIHTVNLQPGPDIEKLVVMRWGEGGNDEDSAVPSWSLGSYDLGVIIVGSVKSMYWYYISRLSFRSSAIGARK